MDAKQQQIEWCRSQQLQALEHLAAGHSCDHPQCHPENNKRWGWDAFAEEFAIQYGIEDAPWLISVQRTDACR